MRLGVDLDGVCADFDKGWVDLYNADFGTNLEYKQNDHWDSLVSITHFNNDTEWWEWVVERHPCLFLLLDPLPGAREGIDELKQRGHEICIITAKPEWAAAHTAEWLSDRGFHYDELHITKKKSYVVCDVYIDDAVHNVVDLMENTDALVIQYSAWPYVNGGKAVPGATVCTSWPDIVKSIDSYADNKAKERARARAQASWQRWAETDRLHRVTTGG